jgi:DNA-directed RNA polymerase specialized sigma24 family protein
VHFSQELVEHLSNELAWADAESNARLVLLDKCVKKLTEWQRSLLLRWCAVERDPSGEVGAQLGRRPEAIRQALLRIRRKLYRCIEEAERKEAEQP